MSRRCRICNEELEEWEETDICQNCQDSIMTDDNIDLGIGC